MNKDDVRFAFQLVLFILMALICVVPTGISIDYLVCKQKTSDIGFDSRYLFFGGCQIEVQEGQWIPLDSYYFKEE